MGKPNIDYHKHGNLKRVEHITPTYQRSFKTKLCLTQKDQAFLKHVGTYLHSLYAKDIKDCFQGKSRTERKRALTVLTSSRWAGSITQASQTQVDLVKRNNKRVWDEKRTELYIVRKQYQGLLKKHEKQKTSVPVKVTKAFEYEQARLTRLINKYYSQYQNNYYPVVLGGKKLFKQVTQSKPGALERWGEKRLFLTADGETNKKCGNQTIKINKDGYLVIKIPKGLINYYGQTHYTLENPIVLYKGKELIEAHIKHNLAVSYTIECLHDNWSLTSTLDVSKTSTTKDLNLLNKVYKHSTSIIKPTNSKLSKGKKYVLGIDINRSHLACHRLDYYGNPVGAPVNFHYKTDISSTHTQAQVLHALDQLFHYARRTNVGLLVLEDLKGFTGSKSKNVNKKGKRFRAIINSMPVAQLKQKIFDRASLRGIRVCMVNPAYTSQLGEYYWANKNLDRHETASIVIGRRGLGYRAHRYLRKDLGTLEDVPKQSPLGNDMKGKLALEQSPLDKETQTVKDPSPGENGSVLGASRLGRK